MNLENINFKAKDVVQFGIYIFSAVVLFTTLSSKVDSLTEAVKELKEDRKEFSGENKISNQMIQNELKALNIRAELNRQSIEIIKADIAIMKSERQINNR